MVSLLRAVYTSVGCHPKITGFAAHDTIEPGELWQQEIEVALKSMDAMAAILTLDFPNTAAGR